MYLARRTSPGGKSATQTSKTENIQTESSMLPLIQSAGDESRLQDSSHIALNDNTPMGDGDDEDPNEDRNMA